MRVYPLRLSRTPRAPARFLVLAALALTAALFVAPAAQARAKPDLVVRAFQFKSPFAESTSRRIHYSILDSEGRGRFGVVFKVKNIGERRSPGSTARIVAGGEKVGSEQVGPIPPGGSRTVSASFHRRFTSPGRYSIFACADFPDAVNESRERNNCTPDKIFRAVPRRWDATTFHYRSTAFDGGAPFNDSDAAGLRFDLFGLVNINGDVRFLWLARGAIRGTVSGDDGTCTYSGNGSASHFPWDVLPPIPGYLEMDTDLTEYAAEVGDENASFGFTQSCTGYPPLNDTIGISPLLTYGSDGDFHPMHAHAKSLAGSRHFDLVASQTADYTWSFKADIP
jgi:hypothetical protein